MVDRSRDPLLSAFGGAVRSLRLALGLSQESLAEAAHLHVTYVSSLERGRRNVFNLNAFFAVQDGSFHAHSLCA